MALFVKLIYRGRRVESRSGVDPVAYLHASRILKLTETQVELY